MVIFRGRKVGGRYGARSPAGHPRAPKLGGPAPPVYNSEKYVAGSQLTRNQDPRAPPPVTPTAGALSSFDVGGLSLVGGGVLTTASQQSGTVTLNAAGDIFQITEDITETLTGTVTTSKLLGQALDHYTIADATGAVVWNQSGGVMQELTNCAFLSPGQGGSLGGSDQTLANVTTAQENVQIIAGLRLPASRGPWKFTPTLASISAAGGTQATADTVSIRLGGNYSGNVGGVTSYYVEQSNVTLNAGNNYFNQFAAVKNVQLQGMFVNPITLANITGIYIEQNGNVIEPLTYGLNLQAQMKAAFPAITVPTNSLILANPVLKSSFAINDSSQSYINMSAQATGVTIGYYYLK